MIDEVAEVKQYLDGNGLEDSRNHYRACYMITRYYKGLGLTKGEIFQEVTAWIGKYGLKPKFSVVSCISAAYENDNELRDGATVRISGDDADRIRLYTRTKEDRRVALALLCCAKCYTEEDGSFVASASGLSSWLGMDVSNLRQRQLRHLLEFGFVERVYDDSTLKGWKKNYYRRASRFRLLVPYDNTGQWALEHNDIRKLYELVFQEPYD